MSLRPLLRHLEHHPDAAELEEPGASAFVSQALRPFLIAAVADRDVRRPTVVVAGDDRAARDLAADLRAWLAPARRCASTRAAASPTSRTSRRRRTSSASAWRRSTRSSRPSPSEEAPVVVVSAVALSEKVPDPELRPHGFTLEVGELLDLDETVLKLVAAGYERVDQVEDRGQFAVRGGLLDIYPATEERAVRVELFDIEIESLRWFSTFTQRSLGEGQRVEIAPAAELAAEHRELAEIAALEDAESRPDVAELLPVDRFRDLLGLLPEHADIVIAADEDVEPSLRDHWDDVCAAFHDTDAHHLYVKPADDHRGARRAASRCGSPRSPARSRSSSAPRPPSSPPARSSEAEPELEKLTRSGYTTLVTWPQHGQGERAAYNLQRLRASWDRRRPRRPRLRRGQPARRLRRPAAEARRDPRAQADPPPRPGRAPDAPRPRPAALASPTCAPATSSSTRTTGSRASPASTPRPSPASPATT